MWNYLVSGLALGCTLVMYDGSPLRDPAYLWNLVDELGITIYGTSAKYLDGLAVSDFDQASLSEAQRAQMTGPLFHRNATRSRRRTTASPLSATSTQQARHSVRRSTTLSMNRSRPTSSWAPSQVGPLFMIRPLLHIESWLMDISRWNRHLLAVRGHELYAPGVPRRGAVPDAGDGHRGVHAGRDDR